MAELTIIDNSGTEEKTFKLYASKVQIGGTKTTTSTPNANLGGPIEVQTNSYENLSFNVQGIKILDSGLSYDDVLRMYKHKYTGSNKISMKLEYGSAPSNVVISNTTSTSTSALNTYEQGPVISIPTAIVVGASAYLNISNTLTAAYMKCVVTYEDNSSDTLEVTQPNDGEQPAISENGRVSLTGFSTTKAVTSLSFSVKSNNTNDNYTITATMSNILVSHEPEDATVPYVSGLDDTYDYETNGVPVILKSFSYPISAADSKNGYLPTISLNFVETA